MTPALGQPEPPSLLLPVPGSRGAILGLMLEKEEKIIPCKGKFPVHTANVCPMHLHPEALVEVSRACQLHAF